MAHTRLSSQLQAYIEYRISIATVEQPDAGERLYNGTAELWWASVKAMKRSFDTEPGVIAGDAADALYEARVHIHTKEYHVIQRAKALQPVVKLS